MATILCSVIEYVHYSRAIHVPSRRKKYCVDAIEVHDSLAHHLSDYLHFLA